MLETKTLRLGGWWIQRKKKKEKQERNQSNQTNFTSTKIINFFFAESL